MDILTVIASNHRRPKLCNMRVRLVAWLKMAVNIKEFYENRPFYRYGGHIELIRFKEYYRMPRGYEYISFVFSSVFWNIFS